MERGRGRKNYKHLVSLQVVLISFILRLKKEDGGERTGKSLWIEETVLCVCANRRKIDNAVKR
jgi:hypothetical protein